MKLELKNRLIFLTISVLNLGFTQSFDYQNRTNSTDGIYEVQKEIVNFHNFSYLINPEHELCSNYGNNENRLFLLIYVHSTPSNYKRRIIIRETWSNKNIFSNIRIVFMTGLSNETQTNELLKLESSIYKDIVQEDFVDSYKNLTYKGIMAMKWISEYCSSAPFVLKIDDDMIVNTFYLVKHLNTLIEQRELNKRTIICYLHGHMKVIRVKESKWYLSKEEFENEYFKKYCSGSAYILTGDLPKLMYQLSFHVRFFWVDDYYMTGLLARAAKARHLEANSLFVLNSKKVENEFNGNKADWLIFGHFSKLKSSLSRIQVLWNKIYEHYNKNS